MDLYYFFGDKVRQANADEISKIGLPNAQMWEGRLMIPIKAKNREKAWEKARAAAADYEAKTGIKITNLGWSPDNPYDKAAERTENMKKVELLGLEIEVEFDEEKIFDWENSDGETTDAVITTCGRLIAWDDGANSWVQVARWAE